MALIIKYIISILRYTKLISKGHYSNNHVIIVLIFRSVKQVIIKTFVCIAYIDFLICIKQLDCGMINYSNST